MAARAPTKGRIMKPCKYCGDPVNENVYEDEIGMCLDCSNAYYEHGHHDECSWLCMSLFDGKAR